MGKKTLPIIFIRLMNPGGCRGGLVSVLCALQWIHPIMSTVEKGGREFIKKLQQVKSVSGVLIKVKRIVKLQV